MRVCGLGSSGSDYGPLADTEERGNKSYWSINGGISLNCLSQESQIQTVRGPDAYFEIYGEPHVT